MHLHTHAPARVYSYACEHTHTYVHTCTCGHIRAPWDFSCCWVSDERGMDAALSPHYTTDAVLTQDRRASHSCTGVTLVPTLQCHSGDSPQEHCLTPLGGPPAILSCAMGKGAGWGPWWAGGLRAVLGTGSSTWEHHAGVIKMRCLFYLSTTVSESYRALS